jgi:hypothetical protein
MHNNFSRRHTYFAYYCNSYSFLIAFCLNFEKHFFPDSLFEIHMQLIMHVYILLDISKSRSLEILNLSYNNISNIILSFLNGLPHLKTLDLSWNNLNGPLDIVGEYL